MTNYFKDSDGVRYELYQTNGDRALNWLFFPGGPGGDSRYLRGLVDELSLPGNIWLIDMPGNGDNMAPEKEYDYDKWLDIYPKIIKKFKNPVHVGHSFGGMLPLIFPECENYLKGLMVLNSIPSLWLEAAQEYAKQFDLPDLSKDMGAFIENPNQETFDNALAACTPYYFPPHTLEQGKEVLSQLPFAYKPAVWWQRKALEMNFNATWIPESVPATIVGCKYDCICPFTLFEKDQRFQRENIVLQFVEDAGHLGWVENPAAIKNAFQELTLRLNKVTCQV